METNRFASTETTAVDVEPIPRTLPGVTNTQVGSTAAVLALSTLGLAACSGGSSSSPSAPLTPSAPSGVTATPGNNQVDLIWSASTNATGYWIGRATNSAGPYPLIGQSSSTSFADTSAANGTAYFYVVSASNATGTSINSAPVSAIPVALSRIQAARFLAQAAFGGSDSDIQNLQYQARGVQGWLAQQFAIPVNPTGQLSNVAWLKANALLSVEYFPAGVQSSLWRKLISSPDVLRQRVMLALTDLFVINSNFVALDYKNAAAAYYLDQLEANAFGKFKALLLAVSHTPAMGAYLSFLGNVKANPVTGTSPDENYAREIMQLFSIGVVRLNLDGTPIDNPDDPGVPLATYSQTDVLNMAKVFTGWRLNGASVTVEMINQRQLQHSRPVRRSELRHLPPTAPGYRHGPERIDADTPDPRLATSRGATIRLGSSAQLAAAPLRRRTNGAHAERRDADRADCLGRGLCQRARQQPAAPSVLASRSTGVLSSRRTGGEHFGLGWQDR
jgi:hypothetical protein